ncbi:MAG: NAD(P)H-dependent oxidoreductase [Cyanobacteria bacterium J06597_1]
MATVLRIDSSARVEGSHSRQLADFFQQTWLEKYPADRFITRDVTQPSIPHVDDLAISGFQTPPDRQTPEMKQAVALSDELIAELKQAEVLLISAPMYNFSIPSAMKAWVDQIVRIGHTFAVEGNSFKGLLTTQQAFVLSASGAGGYQPEGPFGALNFVEPYFEKLLGFLGVQEVLYFSAQGMMAGPDEQAAVIEQVKSSIRDAM